MRLVADIGGTNARLGLADEGVLVGESLRSYRNDAFDGFLPLLSAYLDAVKPQDVTEAVVAVAGPVAGPKARLTNRDWMFAPDEITQVLGGAKVGLANDLMVLGAALPGLSQTQLHPLVGGDPFAAPKGQSLVVGIGTGFNVCPAFVAGTGVQCWSVEMGHASLPSTVTAALPPTLAPGFKTVEACFSGRGVQACRAAGLPDETYAQLIGLLCRDLVMAYMPTGGLYFSGGVARAILTAPSGAAFVESFTQPFDLVPDLSIPVSVIEDDRAALIGCARLAL